MPLQETSGNLTTDAYGGGAAAVVANYIEDVFSTYLYTGNGGTQTITNGIDLAGKGGLVWGKDRTSVGQNFVYDTARGATNALFTNLTNAQNTGYGDVTSFNSNGFSLNAAGGMNLPGDSQVSWTWRKQPKYFDIQTWTGSGANRTIAHALGSVPGSIWVKRTDTAADWQVYHQSLANTEYLVLNTTAAKATGATRWNSTTPTSSVFSLGTDATVNASGGTYVAYIFASNAGGFGLTGTDNVISCGSYTGNGSTTGPIVTLGYEPQWLMVKKVNAAGSWYIVDNMRGLSVGDLTTTSHSPNLIADLSNAEQASGWCIPTATGFQIYGVNAASGSYNTSGGTYIYIAIRRGPMKVPTDATKVLAINLAPDTSTAPLTWNTNSTVDSVLTKRNLSNTNGNNIFVDRLRGNSATLTTNSTSQESTNANITDLTISNGYIQKLVSTSGSGSAVTYAFSRAPSFFDEVCYTGTGVTGTKSHNLGVVPELMIFKVRDQVDDWQVYSAALGPTKALFLNNTNGSTTWGFLNNTAPTSTVFTADAGYINYVGTFVAYLFATCSGVSKVGSYTGNGTTQTINCGFGAGGARFVLLKRTDAVGDWYVYDTARGMTTLTDPYLLLNNTAAQTATLGSVTTVSTGFALNSTILAAINVNAGTYIFLAIA
jgi:hypothetical protein